MINPKPFGSGYLIQLPKGKGAETLIAWKKAVIKAVINMRKILFNRDHFLVIPSDVDTATTVGCAVYYAIQMKAIARNIYLNLGGEWHWLGGIGPDKTIKAIWEGKENIGTPGVSVWRAFCTSCGHFWTVTSDTPPEVCPQCESKEIVYEKIIKEGGV